MEFFSQISLYALPAVLLFVVFFDSTKNVAEKHDNRYFHALIISVLCCMINDLAAWIFNGAEYDGAKIFSWLFNILYMLSIIPLVAIWLLYVENRIRDGKKRVRGKLYWTGVIPLALCAALICLSPIKHWFFYIDEFNLYHRGDYYYVPYIFLGIYLVASLALLLVRERKNLTREKGKEFWLISLFITLPLIGIIVQLINYGWWVIWPLCTISLLVIYLNLQNKKVVADALTGLYNRGKLDKFVYDKCKAASERSWAYFIADINDFKAINDVYGHTIGDEALWRTAESLRQTYRSEDCFIARYGGDEFVVICDCADANEAEELIKRAEAEINSSNELNKSPYSLSVSIGYEMFSDKYVGRSDELTASADADMYRRKNIKKKIGGAVSSGEDMSKKEAL